MNTIHTNTLEYDQNGLTVYLGENIGDNAVNSMRHAYQLAKNARFGEVIYLNTFQSEYQLNKTMARAVSKYFDLETQTRMNIVSTTIGELANEGGMMAKELAPRQVENPLGFTKDGKSIDEMDTFYPFGKEAEIERRKIRPKVIIMNSWEFAARDCRHRERLIFMINEWITHKGISVIIYAEDNNRTAKAGKLQRGGFGKLMGLASMVVPISNQIFERDQTQAEGEERMDAIFEHQEKEHFHARRMMFLAALYKADEERSAKEEEQRAKEKGERTTVAGAANIIVSPGLSFGKHHPENADNVDEYLLRRSTPVTEGVYSDVVESEQLVAVG